MTTNENMTHHGITKCSSCQKIIVQCRCMGPHTVIYLICDDCVALANASKDKPSNENMTGLRECFKCLDHRNVIVQDVSYDDPGWCVTCIHCQLSIFADTKAMAIHRWNARVASKPSALTPLQWFLYPNPLLGNVSPIDMIRGGRGDKLCKFVLNQIDENGGL